MLDCALPLPSIHASWKDGGLSMPSIMDRENVLTLRSCLHLFISNDSKVQEIVGHIIKDEFDFRHIELSKEDVISKISFLKLNTDNMGKGTNSILARSARFARSLNISIDLKTEEKSKYISILDLDSKIEKSFWNASDISRFLTERRKKFLAKKLNQKLFHLHAFNHLLNNKLSNFWIKDIHNVMTDAAYKFMIKSRTNNLPTQEFREIINSIPHVHCLVCGPNSGNQSLVHLLNKCKTNNLNIQKIHNLVVKEFVQTLIERHPDYIGKFENRTIPDNLAALSTSNSSLKPDIQFWINPKKLILVEASVPYLGLDDNNNEKIDH